MGSPTSDIGATMYELAKGFIPCGQINIAWDFTDGLTKERFIKRYNRQYYPLNQTICLESGRIIMPALGII